MIIIIIATNIINKLYEFQFCGNILKAGDIHKRCLAAREFEYKLIYNIPFLAHPSLTYLRINYIVSCSLGTLIYSARGEKMRRLHRTYHSILYSLVGYKTRNTARRPATFTLYASYIACILST